METPNRNRSHSSLCTWVCGAAKNSKKLIKTIRCIFGSFRRCDHNVLHYQVDNHKRFKIFYLYINTKYEYEIFHDSIVFAPGLISHFFWIFIHFSFSKEKQTNFRIDIIFNWCIWTFISSNVGMFFFLNGGTKLKCWTKFRVKLAHEHTYTCTPDQKSICQKYIRNSRVVFPLSLS